MAKKPDGVLN
uniref:Uncharacterized protein n=1 Tax=Rhizophora mucronata TaxID=61149 RepID=A0A2P2NQ75_RHIMU